MEAKSRMEYSFLNTSMAIAKTLAGTVLGFIARIVLTHTLSASYVGVNGLFLELLYLLSFSELGISSAMAFALYRPLAEGDRAKLRALMRYYRKVYCFIGLMIFGIGLFILAALPALVKGGEEIPHLRLTFGIYLVCNVLSYPLLAQRTLLAADQREYLLAKYLIGAQFAQYIAQIVVLLTVRNFMLYVLVGCLPTLAANVLSARRVRKIYPFLDEKEAPVLSLELRKTARRDIGATTMQKIGAVAVNNTDHLILSSMIGVTSVARYSNYILFCRGVQQILTSCFNGIINSVGNLGAVRERDEQVRHVFETAFFINQWLYGFASICLFELLSPFVSLCFGETYVFPKSVVLIICVNVFMTGMRTAAQTFHDSLGLYWYDRYRTLAEAAINLVLSIVLTWKVGIMGVFIGTFVSGLMTTFWVEPCVLYREGFHAPVRSYFLRYGVYALVCGTAWIATDIACGFVHGGAFFQFAARLPLCVAIPNLLFFLCYFKTREYRNTVGVCQDFIGLLLKKRG